MRELADRLRAAGQFAIDTEGDSLHHYPARLSLIQVGEPSDAVTFVDPLTLDDLAALGSVLGDRSVVTVLHAGANDLAELKARYGATFASIFDTSIAARFVGGRALGLDTLLREHLGVELPPSRQRDDWSRRPLTPAQETYAAADVLHLFALKDRLVEQLAALGRLAWVEEECQALAEQPAPDRTVDANAYLSSRGARDLAPDRLAILRELYDLRERLARAADRPPFKILAEETLLAIAVAAPDDVRTLEGVPGLTEKVMRRWGAEVLATVARAKTLPPVVLPTPERRRRPANAAVVTRRADALRLWRAAAVERVGLEPGALLPNRLIGAISDAGPRDLDELSKIEGLRRWRLETFGAELLAALSAV